MRGRDLVSGLPKEIIVNDEHIRVAMKKSVKQIVEAKLNELSAPAATDDG